VNSCTDILAISLGKISTVPNQFQNSKQFQNQNTHPFQQMNSIKKIPMPMQHNSNINSNQQNLSQQIPMKHYQNINSNQQNPN